MFELLLLVIVSYRNYKIAREKGLRPWHWVFRTVLWFIGFDFAGVTIYSYVAGINPENIQELANNPQFILLGSLFGILSGYLGYLLVKKQLDSQLPPE